ncbi:hypothetical protein BOA8489_01736 [Boseongicola aestuarii]|uniref:Methyltransferase FkbM domain-containing protein n=1 Tax=Boseongicola aestuarii TaxID=1470561 RepID=A0A238IYZ6_9RHOB|nr:hypothetical protein BOA8489_01736 [Boseongicola aestuarii]
MRNSLKRHFRPLAQNARFISQGFQDPAPNWVKWRVLKKFFIPDGVCVETGTYLGKTTNFLGRNYKKVYSLEPYFPLSVT